MTRNRYVIQRVQEVIVEAENYPQACNAMRELNQVNVWTEHKAVTFVLPVPQGDGRSTDYIKGKHGVTGARAYAARREQQQYDGLCAELGLP